MFSGWTPSGDYMTWIHTDFPGIKLVPAQIEEFYRNERYRNNILNKDYSHFRQKYPELP